jgi:hypothetical protein
MATIRLDRRGNGYKLGRCVYPGCNGAYRYTTRDGGSFGCVTCGRAVKPLPKNLNSSNVDDLRWDGKKWYFLKQKKLK